MLRYTIPACSINPDISMQLFFASSFKSKKKKKKPSRITLDKC